MLTGDENIVDIEFAVLWQIKDVYKYAFDVRNPEENVRAGAEAAMREVIGKSRPATMPRPKVAAASSRTRRICCSACSTNTGSASTISQIQLPRVDPPQGHRGVPATSRRRVPTRRS